MDPLTALTAAAEVTTRIRLLTLVLANDFRHPVTVHKSFAMLDVLSEGRVEIGLGAGWMPSDYSSTGIVLESPRRRLARLEESVAIIDGLFGAAPLNFEGEYYRIQDLDGLPKTVQTPRPPILMGGGGRLALDLAARVADIVGIHARQVSPDRRGGVVGDLSAESIAEKVQWVLSAWRVSGRAGEGPELQHSAHLVEITDSPRRARWSISAFADALGADDATALDSPSVLVGSVEHCIERILEARDRFGLSYYNLGGNVDMVAPIVDRLAGQ